MGDSVKKSHRSVLGLIVFALVLIAMPSVSALNQPIGASMQVMPFESKPSAVEAGSRTVTGSVGNVWDGDPFGTYVSTTYGLSDTYWGVTGFSRPSDTGRFDFGINSVTIHVQYAAPNLGVDDKYRLVYFVGTAGPFVLQDWIGSPATASQTNFAVGVPLITPSGGTQLSRSWGEVGDLGDGIWAWDEIASVTVRVEFDLVGTTDARPFRIYEIWLTVYDEAPPTFGGSTVSIQPLTIANMPLEDGSGVGVFFVDIYAHDMTFGTNGLQAVEFTIKFNPTILQVWDPEFLGTGTWGVYWPWTQENWWTLDNAGGQLSLSLFIPVANTLVDYGLQGSFPVLRIWFAVVGVPDWFSPIHFMVSTMVAPGGNYIPNTSWDGGYFGKVPEFPSGSGIVLVLAPLVALGYVWRIRRKATKL